MEKSRRGWGGCSGSGIAPNSDRPMTQLSACKAAADRPKRGDFLFAAIYLHRGVPDTVFAGRLLSSAGEDWRFPAAGVG